MLATNLGARRPDDPANQFLAVSGTPSIASYRKTDGSMAGPVVWSTVAVPHQHPMDVQTVQDRFPFDLHKAINHVIDNGNRFKLVKDVEALNRLRESGMPTAGWLQLAESGLARFTLDQDSMDAICAQVWGLDGEGAFIPEVIDSYGTNFTTYNVVGLRHPWCDECAGERLLCAGPVPGDAAGACSGHRAEWRGFFEG